MRISFNYLITIFLLVSNSFFSQWINKFGNTSNDIGYKIKTDNSGNIYTVGTFYNTVDFDPSNNVNNLISNGQSDIFFSKYSSDGSLIWANNIGSYATETITSIELDPLGNLYIVGTFLHPIDLDPSNNEYNIVSNGGQDIFIAKYSPNGDFLWGFNIGSIGSDGIYDIFFNSTGNLELYGSFNDILDFDPSSNELNLTGPDIFIAEYGINGEIISAKRLGFYPNPIGIVNLSLDLNRNIIVTGNLFQQTDFDPGPGIYNLSPVGYSDIFFAKYSPQGNFIWAHKIGNYNDLQTKKIPSK